MKKILLALSGGLDSAVLLAYYLHEGYAVTVVNFAYPSKHNQLEAFASRAIVNYYQDKGFQVALKMIDVHGIFESFNSALLVGGGNIPEGHYNADVMKQTVVPARNLIFGSILGGLADSLNIPLMALGVHAGDHFIYPDCRPEFIWALHTAVILATDNKVSVANPFISMQKMKIVNIGINLKVPFALTRTCYTSQELACGKCGSCVERLEAFQLNGIKDPIKYE